MQPTELGTTVSPPTRGWTPVEHLIIRRGDGFPAHAGMDPRAAIHWGRVEGFPRPRGDGPSATRPSTYSRMVSPPTRGWTRLVVIQHRVGGGFPAHAGMDLLGVVVGHSRSGFPRPRGDGPTRYVANDGLSMVSPPTRGWTPMTALDGMSDDGFPAHAGMDPQWILCRQRGCWFPRPRGDGPRSNDTCKPLRSVSPPTRGWTRHRALRLRMAPGFPAHAGMDLQAAGQRTT